MPRPCRASVTFLILTSLRPIMDFCNFKRSRGRPRSAESLRTDYHSSTTSPVRGRTLGERAPCKWMIDAFLPRRKKKKKKLVSSLENIVCPLNSISVPRRRCDRVNPYRGSAYSSHRDYRSH
ncbi:hypothetical protein PUN28_010774 [Cardiocondyla obscurior]|uniref:Secreted protein n=1 Tax=Cardiocondyla obscurior TaxID=286306 RepID=A0AAW2FM71_9HYME